MPLDMETKEAFESAMSPIKDVQRELKAAQGELVEQLRELDEKKAAADDLTDITGRLTDSQEKLSKLGENYTAMQKKLAAYEVETQDVAAQIARADGFKSAMMQRGGSMEFKDVTTASITQSATLPTGVRTGSRGMISPARQRLFLRDVIPAASTNLVSWEYLQETGYTNNTAVVPEGTQKPQSELTFSNRILNVKKLAHSFRMSEEMLDDVDGMESYIREAGLWGLAFKEEEMLLTGDGTASELDGLLMASNHTAYANTTVPGLTPVHAMDDILVAMTQVQEANLFPSAVIMNAKDVAAMRGEKDADGRYLNPAFGDATAWGLPVVSTFGLAQGQFIVGGFVGNARIWQRKGIEVRRSTEDRDNFIKNLVTILIEERLNLEVLRPEGIVAGSLTTTP